MVKSVSSYDVASHGWHAHRDRSLTIGAVLMDLKAFLLSLFGRVKASSEMR